MAIAAKGQISSGITALDERLGGLQAGRYYLLTGSPGSGKSSACLHFIAEGLRNGESCAILTQENADDMFAQARFIVLTTYDGDEDIFRAMQAGARAYLLKGMPFEELLTTIHAVHRGKLHIPSTVAEKLAERVCGQELTARELIVLERIVAGRANKEIAADLCVSEATVKTHINSLLSKLGVSDRTQAASTALQRGIVHFD